MKNFNLLIAIQLLFAAGTAFAENAPFVDIRGTTYYGKVTSILSPTQVEITIKRDQVPEILRLRLADIAPGNGADPMATCKTQSEPHRHHKSFATRSRSVEATDPEVKAACKILSKAVLDKKVGVEITQWNQPTSGYLSKDGSVINFDLISTGEYRVDYTQSRAANLVILEKEARCKRVGNWEKLLGDRIEDMKCQE